MAYQLTRAVTVLAAVAAISAAAHARAATFIQNFSLASTGTTSANVLQFDTTLGELLSVDFGVANVLLQSQVENPQQTTGTATFNLQGAIGLRSADANAPVLPAFTENFSAVLPRSNSIYTFTNNFPNQSISITSGLDAFKGSSSFLYDLSQSINIKSANRPYGATTQSFGQGDFNITYNFREAVVAVPEPATWAMMILGFGVIGASMRRRANQSVTSAA